MNTASRRFFGILLALVFSVSCVAQGSHKLPEIKFEKFTLPNGLTVLTRNRSDFGRAPG